MIESHQESLAGDLIGFESEACTALRDENKSTRKNFIKKKREDLRILTNCWFLLKPEVQFWICSLERAFILEFERSLATCIHLSIALIFTLNYVFWMWFVVASQLCLLARNASSSPSSEKQMGNLRGSGWLDQQTLIKCVWISSSPDLEDILSTFNVMRQNPQTIPSISVNFIALREVLCVCCWHTRGLTKVMRVWAWFKFYGAMKFTEFRFLVNRAIKKTWNQFDVN